MSTQTDKSAIPVIPSILSEESSAALLKQVWRILEQKPKELCIDCSRLIRITSSDINTLWRIHELCNDAGSEARFIKASIGLVRVLKVLDLYDLMRVESEGEIDLPTGVDTPSSGAPATELSMTFTADKDTIMSSLSSFSSYLHKLPVPRILSYELETVFYEVATNIRQHSRLAEGDQIEFTAKQELGLVRMQFMYPGLPYDPTHAKNIPDPIDTALSGKKRGFGIPMIRRMTDIMSYTRRDGRHNVLTLEKRWS